MFAKIIVDISHEKLDRIFEYSIPDELLSQITVGSIVDVPFGRGNKVISGYVLEISETSEYDSNKLKAVIGISKKSVVIPSNMIKLAAFIKQTYGGTFAAALRCTIPVKEKTKTIEKIYLKLSVDEDKAKSLIFESERKNAKARARLLRELLDEDELLQKLVIEKLGIGRSTINRLCEMGVIEKKVVTEMRNPVKSHEKGYDIVLNDRQREISSSIKEDMKSKDTSVHLLHGITGSGKTEVYIDLIDEVIKSGKEAIVLIPEIALTYQTVKRFQRKFGEYVSIINSKLSAGEKYDQFERAKRGEIKIIIGPRSALFTPFNNLGLIIIDEEHERTYKSEMVPKYHAREVAIKRAEYEHAAVVLGSATPSIESYYNAKKGIYKLHELNIRARSSSLADVSVVDMRQELKDGNKSMFSRKLHSLIEDRLGKNEQVMIFLNRRGYANFVSCRSCGFVIKCPHCDISLKPHRNGVMMCHYCGYESSIVKECPKCGSKYIKAFGTGTQKVEAALISEFPKAKVLRMDMDTTRAKDGHEKILAAFANKEADILVGTQMIVKGHDFENVSLVGIIAADLSLYSPDFRATENTFELLTQAAGRAGRGRIKGDVVIQTYSPDNYSIEYAKDQDYKGFYETEIAYRKLLKFPPVYSMAVVLIFGEDVDKTKKSADMIASLLKNNNHDNVDIFGPAIAQVGKINDNYRYVIYLKHMDSDKLSKMDTIIESNEEIKMSGEVHIQFDLIPMDGY